jgi:GTP cyclohydrolase FolE2
VLPAHQRGRPAFAALFERDQLETIQAMDAGGSDIPGQVPATRLRIQRVGVSRHSIPVAILDPLGSGEVVHLSCDVSARMGLGPDRRGIHVSRIGDHLAKLSGKVFGSLEEYALHLSQMLRDGQGQGSDSAAVSVKGVFTYIEQIGGEKEKSSLEHLELGAAAERSGSEGTISLLSTVGFTHMTACPCVQQTYRHSFRVPSSGDSNNPEMPLLTHSQRCRTRIELTDIRPGVLLPELLTCIDAVVIRSQNTLPRDEELMNVFRAHVRAQFLEDILRDLLASVFALVRGRSPDGAIAIRSTSMESIHDFDLEGEIAYSLGELEEKVSMMGRE